MQYPLKLAVIIFTTLLLVIPATRPAEDRNYVEVSLISLIANPEKFDGEYVLIKGVAYLDHHYSLYAVYLTREDKRAANDKNAIYLILAPSLGKVDQLNDKYVMTRGLFSARDKGQSGSFSGSLAEVDLIRSIKLDIK